MIVDTREMSLAEAERLVKLCQECAEVVVACTKALMYGWAPAHAGIQYDNRADIEEELGDVQGTATLMAQCGDISGLKVTVSAIQKRPRMLAHMRFQHDPLLEESSEPEYVTEFL